MNIDTMLTFSMAELWQPIDWRPEWRHTDNTMAQQWRHSGIQSDTELTCTLAQLWQPIDTHPEWSQTDNSLSTTQKVTSQ